MCSVEVFARFLRFVVSFITIILLTLFEAGSAAESKESLACDRDRKSVV